MEEVFGLDFSREITNADCFYVTVIPHYDDDVHTEMAHPGHLRAYFRHDQQKSKYDGTVRSLLIPARHESSGSEGPTTSPNQALTPPSGGQSQNRSSPNRKLREATDKLKGFANKLTRKDSIEKRAVAATSPQPSEKEFDLLDSFFDLPVASAAAATAASEELLGLKRSEHTFVEDLSDSVLEEVEELVCFRSFSR